MSDIARLGKLINQLLATEARSIVHHLDGADAPPYLTVKTYPIWRSLHHMVAVSRDHQERLRMMLGQIDQVAVVPTFDSPVAGFHYLSMDHLLPKFIEEKAGQIAVYQEALTIVTTELQHEMDTLHGENQLHLDDLNRFLDRLPKEQAATYTP